VSGSARPRPSGSSTARLRLLHERCIGCGNCVRVCSQGAKVIVDSTDRVRKLLSGEEPVAAIVAPSFPAEFGECNYRELVGMIRGLGFSNGK